MTATSPSYHLPLKLMKQWFYVYRQWLQRELQLRFRTSALGQGWLVIQPLAQIILFTLVFYEFFQVRWPSGDGSVGEYGLQVFIGLGIYGFVAEVINRSPSCISSHPYLVTKVRFPLLLLPTVTVGAAATQMVLSLVIAAAFAMWRQLHIQALLIPLALLPLVIYSQALSWLLSSAGVYLRDIGHLAPSASSLLLFMTPIFYPADKVPVGMQWLIQVNPLAWTTETVRGLLMHGQPLAWQGWGAHLLAGFALLAFSRWFFVRIQPGFSDVL